jgi:hypothetical protein
MKYEMFSEGMPPLLIFLDNEFDCVSCPLMLYSNMLIIDNSVQKFTCDILGNVVTISIN